MQYSLTRLFLCLGATAGVACTGQLDANPRDGQGDVPGDDEGDVPEPPEVTDVLGPKACEAQGRPLPLRRLTRTEYRNIIADLFAGMPMPKLTMPGDPIVGVLDNNAGALSATQLHVDDWFESARAIAASVTEPLLQALPCKPQTGMACADTTVAWLGRRLFRRPLDGEERKTFAGFFTGTPGVTDFRSSLQLTLQAMLSAPQFLYRRDFVDGDGKLDAFTTAERLASLLWQSTPDDVLLDAAAAGALAEADQVRAEVDRMLADDRARRAFLDINRQWTAYDRVSQLTKLPADSLTDDMKASMQGEAERFIADIVWAEGGNLETLLTSNETFLDARLAPLYGQSSPGDGWQRVSLDSDQRAGFLTQSSFLAGHGHPTNPSPVLRGTFLLRRVLCAELGDPPPGADQTPPEPEGEVTNREGYAARTEPGACGACHKVINPLGYALEHYDTMGRFRTMDNGKPVDARVDVLDQTIAGGPELARALAARPDVAACVAGHFVRYAFAAGPDEDDECLRGRAARAVRGEGGFRAMLTQIATSPAFFSQTGDQP